MDITLTPEVINSLTSMMIQKELLGFLLGLVGILIFFGILFDLIPTMLKKLVDPKGAKEYRDLLSDMYVIGKVKQVAKTDSIDLIEELKTFNKISKKGTLNLKSIDKVVENELKSKIAKVQEDAVAKAPKKE